MRCVWKVTGLVLQTLYFNPKPQTTWFFPLSLLLLASISAMLLIHCWKDSSGMPLSSVVSAFLMLFTSSNRIPLANPISTWGKERSHTGTDPVNSEVFPVRWYSHPRTAGFSAHLVLILFRHAQIFSDNYIFRGKVISSWFAIIRTVNRRSPHATYLTCSRCPWCNGYRRGKWTRRLEFKSWTRMIAFYIELILLGKVWIQLFSLQLWVNSRTDWVLQPWWGN